jgi:hypothetical protein
VAALLALQLVEVGKIRKRQHKTNYEKQRKESMFRFGFVDRDLHWVSAAARRALCRRANRDGPGAATRGPVHASLLLSARKNCYASFKLSPNRSPSKMIATLLPWPVTKFSRERHCLEEQPDTIHEPKQPG